MTIQSYIRGYGKAPYTDKIRAKLQPEDRELFDKCIREGIAVVVLGKGSEINHVSMAGVQFFFIEGYAGNGSGVVGGISMNNNILLHSAPGALPVEADEIVDALKVADEGIIRLRVKGE